MTTTGLVTNSIPMKKGMTASACLKEHGTLKNTRSLQKASWNNNGSKCYFEIKICLK